MLRRPTVSVIMPCYKSADFVAEAVASVQSQTFTDWELFVVDDASDDGSAELVQEIAELDPRILLVRRDRNSGAAVCRNIATQLATGRYLAYLDADDRWRRDKLESQLSFIEEHNVAAVCAGFERIDRAGAALGSELPPFEIGYHNLLRANAVPCLTVMYDTEACGKHYASNIRKRNDYSVWLSVARDGVTFRGQQEVLADYRIGSGSLARNKLTNAWANFWLIYVQERAGFAKALYNVAYNSARFAGRTNYSAKSPRARR